MPTQSPETALPPPSAASLDAKAVPPAAADWLALVGDAVVVTDESGRIVLFNRAAETIFGYAADEALGAPVEMLIPERFRSGHIRDVAAFARGGETAGRVMGHRREVLGLRRDGDEFPVQATVARGRHEGRLLLTVAIRDASERIRLEEQRRLMVEELNHRVKNMIAIVNALVSLSARGATSVDAYRTALQRRLGAMSETSSLLDEEGSSGASLAAQLEHELGPWRDQESANVRLAGPHVTFEPKAELSMRLAIHELATNAAKYGALSVPVGRVDVTWRLDDGPVGRRLVLDWQEAGGPTVAPPQRRGFGSTLIEALVARSLGGAVRLDFRAEGLQCRIELPLGDGDSSVGAARRAHPC
ncbi:PAS domain S-box protein [Salinarimonas rosea]|uniref:PAS domain S-box protein n=1 Tax=Salinarimonas rosea TaxID=552063 RepID=UPI0004223B55|nr:PAS domain S-box protein [Salinarimonas rosea]